MRLLLIALFAFNCSIGSAQISFTDNTSLLGIAIPNSGAPVGVADINNDNRDDIIALDQRLNLVIYYQNADGTFTSYIWGSLSGSSWAIAIADTDNDGDGDIITGGAYNGVKHLVANSPTSYTLNNLDGPNIFVQGSSIADVDNDGFLDGYACHDDGPNLIWQNDGNGTLSDSGTSLIDYYKYPTQEENAGNYGVCWTDFDRDGDLDMYIAKCRLGASLPTDVRRINQLWENDGNNNYTENAAAYGLDVGWQSWAADFQDIDNDGDFDVFLANHDANSQLFENDNGTYVDITATSGVVATGSSLVQSILKDMDNDGFVDIMVSGKFFHNNGDKTFTEIPSPFGTASHSWGIGDLNQDGFLDMYAGYATGFNSPSGTDDVLWFNDRNDNNFLVVHLDGTISNRDAVGAIIEIEGAFGTMVREIRSGESYGINNSQSLHFGLGTHDDIDKMTVFWPSGTTSVYNDIAINQSIFVKENGCKSPNVEISSSKPLVMCSGDFLSLTANSNAATSYSWSTGQTSQTIAVNAPGEYKVTVSGISGCESVSKVVEVVIDDVTCNDPCMLNQFLHGNVSSDTYKAVQYIKSNGTVMNGNVVFQAGDYVEMIAGFETIGNNPFEAKILGCN